MDGIHCKKIISRIWRIDGNFSFGCAQKKNRKMVKSHHASDDKWRVWAYNIVRSDIFSIFSDSYATVAKRLIKFFSQKNYIFRIYAFFCVLVKLCMFNVRQVREISIRKITFLCAIFDTYECDFNFRSSFPFIQKHMKACQQIICHL